MTGVVAFDEVCHPFEVDRFGNRFTLGVIVEELVKLFDRSRAFTLVKLRFAHAQQ